MGKFEVLGRHSPEARVQCESPSHNGMNGLIFATNMSQTPLLVKEADVVSLIGWLKLSHERGHRCVSSHSIP